MRKAQLKKNLAIVALVAAVVACSAPWLKRHGESVQCGNDMVSICFAAQQWAFEHDGHFPSNFTFLSQFSPDILICPGDSTHKAAKDWASFTPTKNSSYEIVNPDLRIDNPDGVYLRCKIHGHVGYANIEVFDGTRRRLKTMW